MSQLLDVDRVTDPEPTSAQGSHQATEAAATHTWLNPEPAPVSPDRLAPITFCLRKNSP